MPVRLTVLGLFAVAAVTILTAPGQTNAQQPPDAREALADAYVPVVYLKHQEGPCDPKGEAYYPAPVEIVLGNPNVALKNADGAIVTEGPTAADLFSKDETYYLDFPGNPKQPKCQYEEDFKALAPSHPSAVYAHILSDPQTGQLVLQYWLYFYFNDWNNNHESDWEMIQLSFDATSADEALTQGPAEVVYAQHGGGERAEWDDGKLRKEDGHPVIYTPRGSHGSLYGAEIALGKGEPGTGFGCDDASPPSDRFEPEAILIPEEVSGADDPFAWITYQGRWGQKMSGEFNGPTGPNMKTQWAEPMEWQEKQRSSSVTVPEDSIGPNAAKIFCGVVAAGSRLLFGAGPYVVLALGIAFVGSLVVTARRTQFTPIQPAPLRRRRRFGQILRSAFRLQRTHALLFLGIGALLVPLAAIITPIQLLIVDNPPAQPVLDLIDNSVAEGVIALAVGALGFGAAYWLVVSAVISALHVLETNPDTSVLESYRNVGQHLRALLRARLRALSIIILLAVSVVGLPWAARQGVRWLFLEHAILLDGKSPAEARHYSERLVAGHWWRTMGVTVAVVVTALLLGPLVGIAVLLFTSAAVTFINLISSIIYIALIPFAAIALTMLYLDLQLEDAERQD